MEVSFLFEDNWALSFFGLRVRCANHSPRLPRFSPQHWPMSWFVVTRLDWWVIFRYFSFLSEDYRNALFCTSGRGL